MKIFSRFPVFRFLLPFALGILGTIYELTSLMLCASMLSAGLLTAFIFTQRQYATGKFATRWLAGIPFYCCYFGLGGTLTWFHQSHRFHEHFPAGAGAISLLVQIESDPVATRNGYRMSGKVEAARTDAQWEPCRGGLLIFIKDTSHTFRAIPGNRLLLDGRISRITASGNPGAFDPSLYYAGQGLWYRVYAEKDQVRLVHSQPPATLFTYARMLRNALLEKLNRYMGTSELGVSGALLLGYEDWLDPELEKAWSGAGVLHVLCVSGMHVMLIYVILASLLGWMEHHPVLRHMRYLVLLALIWFYAMVTGFSPSVIRASAMITFVVAGSWLNREASIYNLLCSSCILMFTMNPYLITSAGFQLSFLAVCGIIFLHKLIFPLWVAPNRLLHKTWELVSVSIAAQISTFPLSLYLFHQFPNYFLLGNLLIIPLSTLVMYSGLVLLVTDWIPYAGWLFGNLTTFGIRLLNELVLFIGALPGAITENIHLSPTALAGCYLLIILVPAWLVYRSRYWFFAILFTVVMVLTERLVQLEQARRNYSLTVYDTPGKTLVTVIHRRNVTVLSDDTIDEGTNRFVLKDHLIANGIRIRRDKRMRQNTIVGMSSLQGPDVLVVRNWQPGTRVHHPYKNPVLILGGNPTVSAEEILQYTHPSQVIFDASCRYFSARKLAGSLEKLGIQVHMVGKNGAWMYRRDGKFASRKGH